MNFRHSILLVLMMLFPLCAVGGPIVEGPCLLTMVREGIDPKDFGHREISLVSGNFAKTSEIEYTLTCDVQKFGMAEIKIRIEKFLDGRTVASQLIMTDGERVIAVGSAQLVTHDVFFDGMLGGVFSYLDSEGNATSKYHFKLVPLASVK